MLAALREWRERSWYYNKPDDLVFPSRVGGYQNHAAMMTWKFRPLFAKLAERWKAMMSPDSPSRVDNRQESPYL